ncbi:protein Shroom4 isoform X1 [Alosa sapidissima]|uniref:protein Shroom4 isoform X1 n=2 Tax=Alosa sapidissima TaxID=34773 RepID=UPI001C0A006C|nr:protein Shroom4 isoform X1 [Alosa sapidissima]
MENPSQIMETVEQLVSFNHIHVQLLGGAPWGFTLKGGLEHGEPLIITKIEDGGKAAQTKKLRVGDELININGSPLYGSRQEALILIKGSYRTLKIIVRRRSVPCRRPHSWHLAKQAEPLSVTGTSTSPSDMQLHPAHFPTLWHSSNNNSDLSMQWRPLSRHHSNSGGSMESLETPPPPSQSYFDSQLSPVDPAIFNNKRDSAYSSFSASSNTSDYTVSLRPDVSSSMDNILQGLGPGRSELRPPSSASGPGDLQEEPGSLKSRLAFLRPEAKTRPSSYSYEDEHRGPPQPPARKDSFRATRARPGVLDKRCTSAPVGIPTPPSCLVEDQQRRHTISEEGNGFENGKIGRWKDSKGSSLEPYYIITSDTEPCAHQGQVEESKNNFQENHLQNLQKGAPSPMPRLTESLTAGSVTENPLDVQFKPENNHLFGSHQYSPTENLPAPQVQLLEFCDNQSDRPLLDHSRWSQPLLPPPVEQGDPSSPDSISTNKWSESRCSTPGSSDVPRWVKPSVDTEVLNASVPPQHVWGRSVSVPGEQVNGFPSSARSASSYSPALEQQFQPISSAVSMDAMLEECHENKDRGKRDEVEEILKPYQKSSAARQLRSSKSRRRNERFATNLRNEIQRKKAELQKSRSPVGLLDCGETVKEEESSDFLLEREETLKRGDILIPSSERQPSDYPGNPHVSHSGHEEFPSSEQLSKQLVSTSSHPTAISHQPLVSPPRHQRPSGLDAACIVEHLPPKLDYGRKTEEEVTGASKARRWRWAPGSKLQPETDLAEKRRVKGEVPSPPSHSAAPPRTNPPPIGRSSSRTVESDILPFADRRKFFEETSRNLSHSVSNLSRMNMPPQKTERQWCQPNTSSLDPARPSSQLAFRRFSYQGGLQQDGLYRPTGENRMDNRRQFVNESQERNRGRDRACDSVEENDLEKLREAAREKVRELEKLREMEREMELEQERKREKEIQSELLQREWAKERELVSKIDRLQLTDKHPEHINTYNEEKWEMEGESPWRDHGFYGDSAAKPVIQDYRHRPHHSQSLQPSHCYQTNGHADSDNICSAFNPVGVPVHSNTQSTPPQYTQTTPPQYTQTTPPQNTQTTPPQYTQSTPPQYTLRSYTPPEAYPVSEREQTKLNRKFSLTERDYAQCRQDRLANGVVYQGYHGQRRNRVPVSSKSDCFFTSPLRSRAMSENNLSVDQWSSYRGGMSKSPVLKEEEGRAFLTLPKQKASPPPRPPPPKWDQFYRRRASHHSLFPSSTPALSSALHSQPEVSPSSHLSAPEVTRQRAYSLPPREGPVSCHPCQERPPPAPFSNNHSQRSFRPVVPAPKEKVTPFIPPEQCTRLFDAGTQEDQSPPTVLKPASWKHRGTAEWDCSATQEHFSRDSSPGLPPGASIHKDNNTYERELTPESYLTMDHLLPQQQQHHQQRRGSGTPQLCYRQQEPPKTCTEPARQEPDAPIETDIDELSEGETLEDCKKPELQGEMQCFACPITVLETDVDALAQTEAPEVEARMGPKTSPAEHLPLERSGDTLERLSGPSSDGMQPHGTTYYRKSAANTQLFNQMNASLNMSNIEDEELNYKRQLMESLRKKLSVLLEAQRGLQEDVRANVQLGEEIEALVMTVCKPNEVDKFRMFIGDLEKVVSLRLSLSGRLLRVESALDCLGVETGHHERLPLLEKKQQLLLQLGEAQELKEHVDRREEAVGRVLGGCLTPEQLRDYKHFVKMKAALLVEQRQLDDKIRLGEEQLRGLRESLGPGGVLDYGH